MANNYPVGFYFELSFKDEDAAFKEVSSISKELSMEEVVCGAENRFNYPLPTITTSQNLVLKRALIPEGSKLIDWYASTLDEGLANSITTHNISSNNSTCINGNSNKNCVWKHSHIYDKN